MIAFFLAMPLTQASYADQIPVWHRHGRLVGPPLSAQLTTSASLDEIAPFSLAERDIGGAQLSLAWRPAEPVQLTLSLGVLAARWPDGTQRMGPDDLRLATQARLVKSKGRAPDLWLAWGLKLPNAEQPLGSNEADTDVMLWARKRQGAWHAELGAGIWIAGHPDQLAAQDDALLVQGRASYALGPGFLLASGDLRWRSARNPSAGQVGLGWEQPVAERVQIGASVDLGLTPAAPNQALRLWLALVPRPRGT